MTPPALSSTAILALHMVDRWTGDLKNAPSVMELKSAGMLDSRKDRMGAIHEVNAAGRAARLSTSVGMQFINGEARPVPPIILPKRKT